MRNDVRSRMSLAAAALLVSAAALTACSATDSAPGASPVAPETTPPVDTMTTTPTESAGPPAYELPNTVAAQPGDCPLDPAAPGVVTFVVTADDDITPIELTYTAFRPGSDPEVRTATTTGPSVMLLQTSCGEYGPWTFSATSATGGSLSCALFYGGMQLKSASDYAEGDVAGGTAVDCSATPGM